MKLSLLIIIFFLFAKLKSFASFNVFFDNDKVHKKPRVNSFFITVVAKIKLIKNEKKRVNNCINYPIDNQSYNLLQIINNYYFSIKSFTLKKNQMYVS